MFSRVYSDRCCDQFRPLSIRLLRQRPSVLAVPPALASGRPPLLNACDAVRHDVVGWAGSNLSLRRTASERVALQAGSDRKRSADQMSHQTDSVRAFLLRRSRGRDDLMTVHRLRRLRPARERVIAIPNQVAGRRVERKDVAELLCRPRGRWPVGEAMWITRRRSCARITRTKSRGHVAVGTTRKSAAMICPTGFARKVFQVWHGGRRWRGMYFATVACETLIPASAVRRGCEARPTAGPPRHGANQILNLPPTGGRPMR